MRIGVIFMYGMMISDFAPNFVVEGYVKDSI